MSDIASPEAETQSLATKSFVRFVPAIVRVLLGLTFLVFGLNGFLNFIPAPKDMPQDIMTVTSALMMAGYMTVVSGAEVLAAVLLLVNRFVPLALALLAPILVGILTFHIAIAPATIVPGIIVSVMELYLVWVYRGTFRPILAARARPGIVITIGVHFIHWRGNGSFYLAHTVKMVPARRLFQIGGSIPKVDGPEFSTTSPIGDHSEFRRVDVASTT